MCIAQNVKDHIIIKHKEYKRFISHKTGKYGREAWEDQ